MPRTLSVTTQAEIAKTVTRPFWLLYIGFTPALRYSSGPQATNGYTWTPNDFVATVSPDNNQGTLRIQNTDYVFGGLVLSNGIADVPIKIYTLYGTGAYSAGDEELLFDGVGGSCTIDPRWVTIDLKVARTAVMFSPRIRCSKEMGFNHLPPEGLVISWQGEQYTLPPSGTSLPGGGGIDPSSFFAKPPVGGISSKAWWTPYWGSEAEMIAHTTPAFRAQWS
jgi:hypothetical protein